MTDLTSHYHHVALLGRPNVGKSTLFNRLLKKRKAVVSATAGTTRDRLKHLLSFNDHQAVLMDMAGLEPALTDKNEISAGMQRQVEQALAEADVIIWVVDGSEGATSQDEMIAELIRRLQKPVIVAVNKCDHSSHASNHFEFLRFGFEPVIALSAVHATGVTELTQAVATALAALPPKSELPTDFTDQEDRELKLALLGRPNVGKSTLLNQLAGSDRAVVSAVSGTTRDAVDTVLPAVHLFGKTFTRFQTVRVIDTAGIRQRGKMGHEIEAWSVLRSLDAAEEAHVVLLVIDGTEGVTHQDLIVAEKVLAAGRPLILAVNKWDAVLAEDNLLPATVEAEAAQEKMLGRLLSRAPFLAWAQVIFISAKTGLHVEYLGQLINRAYQAWSKLPDQKEVTELANALRTHPRLKNLRSLEVKRAQPPVFILHVDGATLPHFTTRRMVDRALRDALSIGPTPIKLWVERHR